MKKLLVSVCLAAWSSIAFASFPGDPGGGVVNSVHDMRLSRPPPMRRTTACALSAIRPTMPTG